MGKILIKGRPGTDSSDLIELIVTATNEEKVWFQEKGLCKKIATAPEVEGPYKELLEKLCNEQRPTDFHYDEREARPLSNNKTQMDVLIGYFGTKYQKPVDFHVDDPAAVEILVKSNYSHLRMVFKLMPIDNYIQEYDTQYFWKLARAIVDDAVRGRTYFFAKQLATKLDRLIGSNMHGGVQGKVNNDPHNDVQRILYGRYHIDLLEIVEEFDRHFAKTFGDGKTLLVILGEHTERIVQFTSYAQIIVHLQEEANKQA